MAEELKPVRRTGVVGLGSMGLQMARHMVTDFGMSKLGPRTFGDKEEMIFLGRQINEQRDYSEKTAEDIDTEVTRLINEARKTAEDVLKKKRATLDKLVAELLVKETLEREEFEKIVA